MSATFYHTKEWTKLSRLFLMSKNYICERCGNAASIAHHRLYLTPENINDPSVALNPDNLEALCQECHNKEHFSGRATNDGLIFNSEGDVIQI